MHLHRRHLLTTLLFILSTILPTSASPEPEPEPQLAQGGGIAATTLAPVQYPVVTNAPSLFTLNGVTSANQMVFTQTFASTALGTWDLGPTPGVGSIGLGSIAGTVGGVKTKRAAETGGLVS